jgi:hypothetical protein
MNAQHTYSLEFEENEAALQDFLRGVTLLGIDERTCKVFGKEGGRLRATGMMRAIAISRSARLCPVTTFPS